MRKSCWTGSALLECGTSEGTDSQNKETNLKISLCNLCLTATESRATDLTEIFMCLLYPVLSRNIFASWSDNSLLNYHLLSLIAYKYLPLQNLLQWSDFKNTWSIFRRKYTVNPHLYKPLVREMSYIIEVSLNSKPTLVQFAELVQFTKLSELAQFNTFFSSYR